ncbi:transglycosylase domain-containing protein [Clostridium guangxiense]|uniref:transglycosylase domain-containing protein n=1 Tax=Clostridium guangxiense TaxID=1662055 RepID=UPI001E3F283A|nr:PBP1A family penicillin-binding protein [Clostridium guangxiense]MCD2345340.1 PBP1A family penicillin-binding protein [Clostridium guangxiense]
MSGNVKTKKTGNIKSKNKKKRFRILKTILLLLFFILLLTSVATAGFAFATIKAAPALDVDGTILNLDQPSELYDDKGNEMDTVITSQKRFVISMNEIPSNLANAFVSIEDERFYKHKGIDLKRIAGAFYNDIKSKVNKQNNIQGASTITQQLIKSRMFLTSSLENRLSLKRKIQEAYLSLKLEKVLTKKQILEAYMNTIFLGGQANGVEAAAEQYFSKDAKDLNLIECAFIAGLAQSPSAYYPFSPTAAKNHNIYLNRTKLVLFKMKDNNYITNSQYQNALNDLNNNKLNLAAQKISNKYTYEWFSLPAVNEVKKDLKSQYHYTDEEVDSLLRDGNLKIYTTMDTNLENSVRDTLNNTSYLRWKSKADKNGIIQPEASAVVYDYRTGEVKAMVGGRGEQPPTSYNRAYSNNYLKPTGSSIKPLTVYAPAIDLKIATAQSTVADSPLSEELQKKYGGYNPTDVETPTNAPMTIRDALKISSNLVAVKLEDKIGLDNGAAYAEKFGLSLNQTDKSSIAAMSLGEIHGTNTLTMAAAYGVFGNNGLYSTPRLYTKVVDKKGNILLQSNYSTRKVISPQAAYVMYNLLGAPMSDNGTGTNARAELGDMPAGGKTGSTTDFRNLWFCGLTPYYSAAVWVGNDDNSSPNVYSNDVAGIWGQIMAIANKGKPIKDIVMPSGVSQVGNDVFIDGTQPSNLTPDDTATQKQNNTNNESAPTVNNNNNQNSTLPQNNNNVPSNTNGDTNTTAPGNNTNPSNSTNNSGNNSSNDDNTGNDTSNNQIKH